ncbi:DNA polymerase III subunit beta [Anaerobiospirillum thomasii]|uniref:Beta sliding clamp n=1 Tax=Anaerobiospirillum thomasii TaxID=179995 RepID=A0A2X0VG89_9GAMM|nr:DNA polymerase III subunit beta [Anaerobiospirillum thomasii]SPT69181.1 DNA polymerase III subunit beta [Anaerobiospirillum thomasii]SPT72266.1 DNA polymerase III subunit beta [Anaerobiospirillum thomasii]
MKFQLPVQVIYKTVTQLSSVAGSTNKDDIVQNIYLKVQNGELVLRATNYGLEMTTTLALVDDGMSVIEGETTVNASKLTQVLSKMPNTANVHFSVIEDEMTITSGTSEFVLRVRSAKDFPVFEEEDVTQKIVLSQKKLKSIIDRSAFCVSADDFRDYLKGIRLEADSSTLSVFTSDGHRMAILETTLDVPVESFLGVCLIKKCATEISKLLSFTDDLVELSFSKNILVTQINNTRLSSKLLICGYPNVRAVIPKIFTTYIVPRAQTNDLISSVAILSSKRLNGVTMNFDHNSLQLRSENSEHEVATAQLEISNDNEPVEISLNASYVNETLNVIRSQNVKFSFSQPIAHAMIEAESYDDNDCGVTAKYVISRVVV